eukprot:CAMPEP_0174868650 /NCGR_PEP_ID=MMETSP1114-20130205/66372_1 /TAXON_ID=312471 /ORGANISM="Neobodo designis, Strain CCAP 1951/1" /LENGTH=43 /DNA_ID= /DNA_START= /DNA_END= /DNA_ORIENTATION=
MSCCATVQEAGWDALARDCRPCRLKGRRECASCFSKGGRGSRA